jgi:hypothetical protein
MTSTPGEHEPSLSRGPAPAPEFAPEIKKALIEQLSKEIQSSADSVTSLRTRYGFTVWGGPYIVLGAIIVATKGMFTVDVHSFHFRVGLVVSISCYLALGYVAGRIEKFAHERANQWRRCIVEVATVGKINPTLYLDEKILPPRVVPCYVMLFAVLLLCFFGVAILVSTIHPKPESPPTTILTPNPK